ncbi:MAG: ureidoglycolate lyase [Betaproteobacteria bacterium]|jgi:ureidoglycolate lyase
MRPQAVELELQPLSAAAFAPYGEVIGVPAARAHATAGTGDAGGPGVRAINGGTSQRWDMPGSLQLHTQEGEPCVAVFRAQAQALGGPWHLLERHRLGTQTFIPLAGARCVVLVARGEAAPEPATLAAFAVDGAQGFTLHADTWHHGLIALDAGDFVVIERRAAEVDCEFAKLAEPVTLLP